VQCGICLEFGGIVYGCLSLGNCLLLYQDEENILGALEACAGVAFGDNVKNLCSDDQCLRASFNTTQFFFAFAFDRRRGLAHCVLLTRQISRLETRIKECIRVESIMVRKPNNKCVMKVNGMEGACS